MEWVTKSFEELSTKELYKILKARVDIFVVEQQCTYSELDGHDEASLHLFCIEEGELVAYARLAPPGERYEQASIGRVLVIEPKRNTGLGRILVDKSITAVIEKWQPSEIKLQAQSRLKNFYGSYGFQPVSEEYDDEGVPHIDMLLKVR